MTGVTLSWPSDMLIRRLDHLFPLSDPADRAAKREERRKHRFGETNGPQHDARVEVDVGKQLALDEVIVIKGNALKFEGQREQRFFILAQFREYLVAGFAQDRRTWVVILVNPVTEAGKPERIALVLGTLDVDGIRSLLPISSSMFTTASFAPPWSGPQSAVIPAATHA